MSFILLGILNSQVDAAGGVPAYDLLETQVLTSTAASVTFSSIPQDYKHLQIRAVGQLTSSFDDEVAITFNNDTTSVYADHILRGNGSNVISSSQTSQNKIGRIFFPGTTSGANVVTALIVDILDYSSGSKNTTIRAFTGPVSDANKEIKLLSGLYNKTNSITSVKLDAVFTNINTGSRFSLYGIRG